MFACESIKRYINCVADMLYKTAIHREFTVYRFLKEHSEEKRGGEEIGRYQGKCLQDQQYGYRLGDFQTFAHTYIYICKSEFVGVNFVL